MECYLRGFIMSALHCLILDNRAEHASQLAQLCCELGFQVTCAARLAEVVAASAEIDFDVAFLALDVEDGESLSLLEQERLAAAEILVMGDADDPPRANRAMRLGASYFFCKPFNGDHLRPILADLIAESDRGDASLQADTEQPCVVDQFGYLRGSSKPMRKLYRLLRKVASNDCSLLIVGESGTGKELVARTVHDLSPRRDQPYVAFNCAAVTETLLESELFGHEKGSFSGADKRHIGLFERAQGGTLLLDEITEMNQELQAKLLRVLETKSVRRVGSEKDTALDVRIISATNRPPEQAVAEGCLRKDLYYRLAQFPVKLSPLRARGEDKIGLAQYFLNELNASHATSLAFAEATLAAIADRDWPGNVRQLRHAVERAYIMSEVVIEPEALPPLNAGEQECALDNDSIQIPVGTALDAAEQQLILAALEKNQGNKKTTADELGISLKTLYNRLTDYSEQASE
jgi:DNA-binding NtrC family response regulator